MNHGYGARLRRQGKSPKHGWGTLPRNPDCKAARRTRPRKARKPQPEELILGVSY